MTSKLTRERLQEIAEDGFLKHGESKELARMALAVIDSEPVRNPVLAYADSYRDMAKQGVESVPIWSVITDLERNIAPLYRHAQQPVVPDYPETLPCPVLLEPGLRFGKGVKTRLVLDAIQRRAEHSAELEAMTPEERAEYDAGIEEFKAMLPQPAQPAQPAPVVHGEIASAIEELKRTLVDCNRYNYCSDAVARVEGACRAAMLQAVPLTNEGDIALHNYRTALEGIGHIRRTLEETFGGLHGTHVEPDVLMDCKTICDAIYAAYSGNSPVIPDGYVMVPKEPTEDMRDAYYESSVAPISRLSICGYQAMLAAAPQSPGSEPATAPGKWIPVSERMPEDSGRYWCYVEEQNDLGKSHYQWNCSWNGDRWWVESEGGGIVTHWMPLPAAPQEVPDGK